MAKNPTQVIKEQDQNDVVPEPDDDNEIVAEGGNDEQAENEAPKEKEAEQSEKEQPEKEEDVRDRIVRLHREKRDRERIAAGDSQPENAADESDPEDEDDDEPEPEAQKPATRKPNATPEDIEVVLKVDGKDVRMKQSEAIALAQQQMAGNNRLSEAKSVLTEVRQLRDEMLTSARAPREPDDPEKQREKTGGKSAPKKTSPHDDDEGGANQSDLDLDLEQLREIARRVQVGDEGDGVEAVKDIVKIAAKSRPDASPEQIARIVHETIEKNQTAVEINTALQEFGTDYPDAVKNEYIAEAGLHMLRDELIADLRNAGISEDKIAPIKHDASALAAAQRMMRRQNPTTEMRSYRDLLSAVGERLTDNFGIQRRDRTTPKQPQPSSTSQQQRLERKRSSSQQPKPAGGRQAVTQTAKPRDRRAIIEQMKKDRGF